MSKARTDFSAAAYRRDAELAEAKAAEWQAAGEAMAAQPNIQCYCFSEAKEWRRLAEGWRECATNA